MTPETRSPYALSIDEARETIVLRARYYKRLVIAVSLGIVTAVVLSLWLRSGWPLLALGLILPLVLMHRAADLRAVHRWRERASDRWARGELDLALLASTLTKVPALPALTVQGMVESLPTWPASKPSADAPTTFETLPRMQSRLGRFAEQALLARAAAWCCALACGVLVLATGRWPVLAGLAVAASLVPCWTWHATVRTRRGAAALPCGCSASDFNWNGVPDRLRQAWPQPGG